MVVCSVDGDGGLRWLCFGIAVKDVHGGGVFWCFMVFLCGRTQ